MAKKKEIDVLKLIQQGNVEHSLQRPEQRGIQVSAPMPKEKPAPARKRFTTSLDADLIEQARMAVTTTLGVTLSGLVEAGLRHELAELAKKRGTDQPVTTAAPRKGRPVLIKG